MPVDGDLGDEPSEPIDRLVIALRAYVTRAPKKPKAGAKAPRIRNSLPGAVDWRTLRQGSRPAIGFWCSIAKPARRPTSGFDLAAYQLRYKGQVWERGAFYEPDVLSETSSRSFDKSWLTRKPTPTASAFAC